MGVTFLDRNKGCDNVLVFATGKEHFHDHETEHPPASGRAREDRRLARGPFDLDAQRQRRQDRAFRSRLRRQGRRRDLTFYERRLGS